jgi:hypothetical protein
MVYVGILRRCDGLATDRAGSTLRVQYGLLLLERDSEFLQQVAISLMSC